MASPAPTETTRPRRRSVFALIGDIPTQVAKCKSVFVDVPGALAGIDANDYGTKYTPDLAPSFRHWNDGVCKDMKIHSPTPYRYEQSKQADRPVMELSYLYVYKGKWGAITVPTCRK